MFKCRLLIEEAADSLFSLTRFVLKILKSITPALPTPSVFSVRSSAQCETMACACHRNSASYTLFTSQAENPLD